MPDVANIDPQRPDDSQARLDHLAGIAEDLLRRCRTRGASQAEVSCSEEHGLSVDVRMGEVETVESTRDRGIGVTVYFGNRKGSASTADLRAESLEATVEQACAIARHTEEDPAAGLSAFPWPPGARWWASGSGGPGSAGSAGHNASSSSALSTTRSRRRMRWTSRSNARGSIG